MNLCFSDERGEGSDGIDDCGGTVPPRDTHTHKERVVCQVKRYAQHREAGAHRAHREPVGLAFFWEHKARGSGLEAARAAPYFENIY